LPAGVTESSGLARGSGDSTFWTHNDGGNAAALFQVEKDGKEVKVLKLNEIYNRDWEDLAQDDKGRLYIGDFGNNSGSRKDLSVKILENGWESGEISRYESIHFSYEAQKANPAGRRGENFDCEAFFYHHDHLYLFSKNTGKNPRYTKLYKMPASPGSYVLTAEDSIRLDDTVTGADISPDGSRFALISYGKLFVFSLSEGKVDFSAPLGCLKIFRGQTEAVLFLHKNEWMVTNEKGKVFRVTLR